MEINYCYSKTGKYKRKYKEKISIDFEEYRGILDYISELDEFKNSVDKLNKSMIRFIDISKIDDSVEQRIKDRCRQPTIGCPRPVLYLVSVTQ